jgi:hypothetical protein
VSLIQKDQLDDLPVYQGTRTEANNPEDYRYHSIKYRVVPMWDGLKLVFFVVIHKSGDFPVNDDCYEDHHYVKDCLVKRLEVSETMVEEGDHDD